MSVARTLLIRASKSPWVKTNLAERGFVKRAVRRFMPGEDLESALGAAAAFAQGGIGTILTQLGENIATADAARAVRDHYLGVLDEIRRRKLPAQLSVKLTQLGLDVDREACVRHLDALAAKAGDDVLWVDMEESKYVDVTLEVYRQVRAKRANLGVCLQAYLRRTPKDLDALLAVTPAIRLVKGAYNEPPEVAFPRKRDTDLQYAALATRLLEATRRGARVVFGTHDLGLVARIRGQARGMGLAPDAMEFHMLYGIRADAQRSLAADGAKVRVLVSYGGAWFAWYLRRLAERPANVWFVVRNLI